MADYGQYRRFEKLYFREGVLDIFGVEFTVATEQRKYHNTNHAVQQHGVESLYVQHGDGNA